MTTHFGTKVTGLRVTGRDAGTLPSIRRPTSVTDPRRPLLFVLTGQCCFTYTKSSYLVDDSTLCASPARFERDGCAKSTQPRFRLAARHRRRLQLRPRSPDVTTIYAHEPYTDPGCDATYRGKVVSNSFIFNITTSYNRGFDLGDPLPGLYARTCTATVSLGTEVYTLPSVSRIMRVRPRRPSLAFAAQRLSSSSASITLFLSRTSSPVTGLVPTAISAHFPANGTSSISPTRVAFDHAAQMWAVDFAHGATAREDMTLRLAHGACTDALPPFGACAAGEMVIPPVARAAARQVGVVSAAWGGDAGAGGAAVAATAAANQVQIVLAASAPLVDVRGGSVADAFEASWVSAGPAAAHACASDAEALALDVRVTGRPYAGTGLVLKLAVHGAPLGVKGSVRLRARPASLADAESRTLVEDWCRVIAGECCCFVGCSRLLCED